MGHLGHGARGKRRELAFDLVGQGAGDALTEQDLSPGKYGAKRGEASVVVVVKVRDQDGVEVEHAVSCKGRPHGIAGPRVYQDRATPVLHQDGVALPHVKDADARRRKPAQAEEHGPRQGKRNERSTRKQAAAGPGPRNEKDRRQKNGDQEGQPKVHRHGDARKAQRREPGDSREEGLGHRPGKAREDIGRNGGRACNPRGKPQGHEDAQDGSGEEVCQWRHQRDAPKRRGADRER